MIIKSYAKVNIFLKITGLRGNYHELSSRFMRVENLYDTLSFIPKEKSDESFMLYGKFGCPTEKNSIYKAFLLLKEYTNNTTLDSFFKDYIVNVEKNIPEFAGLGGGSSNAAAFLRLCNDICKLDINIETLAQIGSKIGADVPFFVYNYNSANVSGIGEIVEPFEEEILSLKTFTPPIKGDTAKVYGTFRDSFSNNLTQNAKFADTLYKQKSADILASYTAKELNDLFPPALKLYPQLKEYQKENWFFSGSGSTFFRIKV